MSHLVDPFLPKLDLRLQKSRHHPFTVSPERFKVEFENDQVRILREKGGPHDKSPMHEHPANVAVYLTDADFRITQADGASKENHRKAGEAIWNDAQKHCRENLSDKPYELVQIELKPNAGRPKSLPIKLDPLKIISDQVKLVFENDQVRVLHAKRGPHQKAAMHEHPAYVLVFLTDLHENNIDGDGKLTVVTRKAGEVVFNNPLTHAEENLSDKPFEAVLIELK